jgi:uncharacterized membrane protein
MIKQIKNYSLLLNKRRNNLLKLYFSPWLFLSGCVILGTILRFSFLTSKPPWTDEFATLVFSLGNSYDLVPLDRVISSEQLLQPLQVNLGANISDVASLLINEDNHPPLYFMLAHWWYKLFSNNGEYGSLWLGRSLPALCGVLSIPAIYYLARVAFSSRQVAYLAAWLMTVSPYGIYLAQEARHYTLGILWVIASVFCLVMAVRYLFSGRVIPLALVVIWIVINGLGFLTHYFFVITLVTEAIALIYCLYAHGKKNKNKKYLEFIFNSKNNFRLNFLKLLSVIIVSFTVVLSWFGSIIPADYGKGMTVWIERYNTFLALISPIFQSLATWITMVSLLPVESDYLPIIILSAIIMLLFFGWLIPRIYRGFTRFYQDYDLLFRNLLGILLLASIGIFMIITYVLKMDITKGARYSFVYFPIVILFLAACLANAKIIFSNGRNKPVLILGLMGLFSAITVSMNLGYQKYYRPDLLAPLISNKSPGNMLIATTHQTLVQTGEMMGIGWIFSQEKSLSTPQFLLAHQNQPNDPKATETLQKTIDKINSPLDLWLVNFNAPVKLNNCISDDEPFPYIDGYNYQLYQCNR